MARHRRALIGGALVACAPAAPPPPPPPAAVSIAPPPVSAPPVVLAPPGDAGPPAKASQCAAVGANEISDDDHPDVAGVGPEVELEPWLTARGTSVAAATMRAKVRELPYSCASAKLGDPGEDALVCATLHPRSIAETRLIGLVVRDKKPVVVLDVLLRLVTLADHQRRFLDLAFALTGPTSFTLGERATNGTTLVWAPSMCREAEQRSPGAVPRSPMNFPAELRDCTGAKMALDELARSKDDPLYPDLAFARARVTQACAKDIGAWTWQKGQFARAPR